MSANPKSNLERLGEALDPFAGADLVFLLRSEGEVDRMRSALEEIAAPDLVTLMIGAESGLTGTYHGPQGFINAWQDFTATFKHLHSEIEELIELGDVVLVETHQKGTTATAGGEIENDSAGVFRFRDGKLQRAEFHLDRAAARRAAGIENAGG
jgi:ketosteroid isomerase-like protein